MLCYALDVIAAVHTPARRAPRKVRMEYAPPGQVAALDFGWLERMTDVGRGAAARCRR